MQGAKKDIMQNAKEVANDEESTGYRPKFILTVARRDRCRKEREMSRSKCMQVFM